MGKEAERVLAMRPVGGSSPGNGRGARSAREVFFQGCGAAFDQDPSVGNAEDARRPFERSSVDAKREVEEEFES
jgi:hypothetical protein